jgi:LPXTG-motif cell wall-anchored protein
MTKLLELIGLGLIGGTIYSFLGMGESELRWPVFWGCAMGALAIIVYRKRKRQKLDQDKNN